jgi:hypothetical protein
MLRNWFTRKWILRYRVLTNNDYQDILNATFNNDLTWDRWDNAGIHVSREFDGSFSQAKKLAQDINARLVNRGLAFDWEVAAR